MLASMLAGCPAAVLLRRRLRRPASLGCSHLPRVRRCAGSCMAAAVSQQRWTACLLHDRLLPLPIRLPCGDTATSCLLEGMYVVDVQLT